MRRLAFYLIVLLAVFVFAVATTKIYFAWNVQFVERGRGSMGMCEKGQGGFTMFDTYDGEKVAFAKARFSSTEEAHSCFRLLEKKAQIVIDRETLFDPAGDRIVGERIVARFAETGATILSLDGENIFEIDGTSLRHALIFEKRSRKY